MAAYTHSRVRTTVTLVPAFKWANGYVWSVTFASAVGPQPLLTVAPTSTWAGTAAYLNVQRVVEGNTPLGGFFTLGFGGQVRVLVCTCECACVCVSVRMGD